MINNVTDLKKHIWNFVHQANQGNGPYNEVHCYFTTDNSNKLTLAVSFYRSHWGNNQALTYNDVEHQIDDEKYLKYLDRAVVKNTISTKTSYRDEIEFTLEFKPQPGADFLGNTIPVDFEALKNYTKTKKKDSYIYTGHYYGFDKVFENAGFVTRHGAIDYPYYTVDGFVVSKRAYYRNDAFTLSFNKAKANSFIKSDSKLKLRDITQLIESIGKYFTELLDVPSMIPNYRSAPSGTTALEHLEKAIARLMYFHNNRQLLDPLIIDRYDNESLKYTETFNNLVDAARNIVWREFGYFENIENKDLLHEVRNLLD